MDSTEFKLADEKALEPYVPKTRGEALIIIRDTVYNYYEKTGYGVHLWRFVSKLSFEWGLRRETIIDYIQTLCRAGQIYEYNFRLYPHLKKEAEKEKEGDDYPSENNNLLSN